MGHGGDEPTICIWEASEEQLPRSSIVAWSKPRKRLTRQVQES